MRRVLAMFGALSATLAHGQDVQWHGYLDLRVISAPSERSWTQGGLGKTRYGDGGVQARIGGAALTATAQFTPALLGYADLQLRSTDQASLELIEAYLRYRPVSLTPWRWSLKVGGFFPPISLENDAIGWTSPWTLTPSAINSWVGEELRGIGTEFALEHRGQRSSIDARFALFEGNDPAGEILAARGWSLSDMTYGFGGQVREPDAYAIDAGVAPPLRYKPYVELDHRPGWYADMGWRSPLGRINVMRYDNRADPTLSSTYDGHTTFAWRTRFWSLGAQMSAGPIELLAQAMTGSTLFSPSPFYSAETDFHAGYLLAGWARGEWRPALRIDFFTLRQVPPSEIPLSEHGNAITAALVWRPRAWLRVTGELLRVDSWRMQRVLDNANPRVIDAQAQLGVRLMY